MATVFKHVGEAIHRIFDSLDYNNSKASKELRYYYRIEHIDEPLIHSGGKFKNK